MQAAVSTNYSIHLSSIQSYSLTTATANLSDLVALKHKIEACRDKQINTITNNIKGYINNDENKPATSWLELNKDLTLRFYRTLCSFDDIEHAKVKNY